MRYIIRGLRQQDQHTILNIYQQSISRLNVEALSSDTWQGHLVVTAHFDFYMLRHSIPNKVI